MITVALVDDHPTLRAGFKAIVEQSSEFRVVAEASSRAEAIGVLEQVRPEIVVVDLGLPDGSGIELIRHVHAAFPGMRILVLTMHSGRSIVSAALAAGADGYILKESGRDELINGLHMVTAGERVVDPRIDCSVDGELKMRGIDLLSPREIEVLRLLAGGATSKEIAHRLSISPKTVDNHRANIIRKTGAGTTAELVHIAVRAGIVPA